MRHLTEEEKLMYPSLRATVYSKKFRDIVRITHITKDIDLVYRYRIQHFLQFHPEKKIVRRNDLVVRNYLHHHALDMV